MPYLSCPAPDITYHLINASPVGTGEQLLDGLLKDKKVIVKKGWILLISSRDS
jgi:hypothetical protein